LAHTTPAPKPTTKRFSLAAKLPSSHTANFSFAHDDLQTSV
jgi:hypothetical protein